MYLNARAWGISPSEFWDMTRGEYILEADQRYRETPEGRHQMKREEWLEQSEMTDEEWWAAHGTSKN